MKGRPKGSKNLTNNERIQFQKVVEKCLKKLSNVDDLEVDQVLKLLSIVMPYSYSKLPQLQIIESSEQDNRLGSVTGLLDEYLNGE